MAPSEPLRLTVLKRFETILGAISAGDTYHYTPHKVDKHPIPYELAKYGPLYQIFSGDEAGPVDQAHRGHGIYSETFHVNIQGFVHDRTDLTTKLEKALADVREAVNTDALSAATGSLGAITDQVRMDESAESGYFSDTEDDFALFNQRWRVEITGTY